MKKYVSVGDIIGATAVDLCLLPKITAELDFDNYESICLDFTDVDDVLPVFVSRLLDTFPNNKLTIKGVSEFTQIVIKLCHGKGICEC